MSLKDHEKFIAFCLLGSALVAIALAVYAWPLPDTQSNGAAMQILNTIVGALTLAFGGAANALFRITDKVKVENTPSEPVPVEPQPTEELPDYAR